MSTQLLAGAAEADITPADSCFLWGYPHVARYSTGVHDRLLASALYVSDGRTAVVFVGTDVLLIPKEVASRARERIAAATGVPVAHVMVTATQTHSGPVTAKYLGSDPIVPDSAGRLCRDIRRRMKICLKPGVDQIIRSPPLMSIEAPVT